MQLRLLRNKFGRMEAVGSGGRISGATGGDATTGARMFALDTPSEIPSRITPAIDSAIDSEVWRAAYRIGVPESELGKWPDAFKALGIESLGMTRAQKTELTALRNKITNIRTRKSKDPEAIRRNINELEELTGPDGDIFNSNLSLRDKETTLKQALWAQGELAKKVSGNQPRGLKAIQPNLDKGLSEGDLNVAFRAGAETADSIDEAQSIAMLARSKFRSETFIEDIEGIAFERIGELIRLRKKAEARAVTFERAIPETANERFARQFEMRRPPGPEVIRGDRIFGTFQNQGLFETLGVGPEYSASVTRFGRGKNFRSWEVYDDAFKRPVHVVQRWNNEKKTWEEVARNPINPNRTGPRVPEYEWIGEPKTGNAVKAPLVEYQNFFYRISQPGDQVGETLSPIRRVRESLLQQRDAYGIDKNQAGKVIKEVTDLIESMASSGAIVPGTPEYSWMHTVFGRLALNISGSGVRVGQTGLVARDANSGRRAASLKALEKSEASGIVPSEALDYLRRITPDDSAYDVARSAYTPSSPAPAKKTRKASRPTGVVDEGSEPTLESERAALEALMAALRS
jgi:hypothetical protein